MSGPPFLSLTNVSKHFGAQRALSDVGIDVHSGEIHALAGHNGSGKSTLVKILAGYHQPEPGFAAVTAGEPFALGDARAAATAGLRFVHQDLGLVDSLDVVDNLALAGGYPTRWRAGICWGRARAEAAELLAGLGYDIDPRTAVGELSAVERTGVAIARAIRGADSARLLVLDEPTAALTAPEVATLFSTIDRLRARGLGVIFVSHHLREIFDICDTVTVLRDGAVVAQQPVSSIGGEEDLVALMLGSRPMALAELPQAPPTRADAAAVLSVRGLRTAAVCWLDLTVSSGEIVGIAGVAGSGRDEVAAALFGGRPRGGEVDVNGARVPSERPDRSIAAGMACLSAQRHRTGVVGSMSLAENVTLAKIPGRLWGSVLNRAVERSDAAEWVARLRVQPPDPGRPLSQFSGGNQQKVLLGRWLRLRPRVLVLDEPTEGVDAHTTAVVHDLIRAAAAAGTAVVVCSSDTDELVSLAHRVVVLRRGEAVATVCADQLDRDAVESLTLAASATGRADD